MSDIVRYEQAHKSLIVGLETLGEKLKALDLNAEGVEFEIQKLAAAAQNARDIAKDRRDRELRPYEEPSKEIKARWAPLVSGFDHLFSKLKLLGADVLRRKRAEADKARAEAEAKLNAARAAEATQSIIVDGEVRASSPEKALSVLREARATLDALPPVGGPLGVKTDEGALFERRFWTWVTTDIDQVPDAYVQRLVDPRKVELAIKNGVRDIPGIKIYQDIEMVSRRAKR